MPRSSAWGTSLTSTCALRHVPPPHTHIYKHSDDFFKCTMAASLPGPWTPCLEFHGTNIKEKTFNFAHPCHLFLPTHYIFQNFHWNEYHIGCMFIFLINYVSSTMFFLIPQNGLGFIPENIEATINIYVQEHWFNWGGGGHRCEGQGTALRSQVSLATLWHLVRLSGLCEDAFAGWATSWLPNFYLLVTSLNTTDW